MNAREQMRNRLEEQLCHDLGDAVLKLLDQSGVTDVLLLEDGTLWYYDQGKWLQAPFVTYEPEQHIHRIGRTGRAGEDGLVLNLASLDEVGRVGNIEVLQKSATEWHRLSELDAGDDRPLVATMVTLQILGGRKEKIRPGDVLGALTGEAGFTREQIGKITVTDQNTYVAVDRAIAHDVVRKLSAGKVKGKTVKVRVLTG